MIVGQIYHSPPIYAEINIHAENTWLDIYATYKNEMEQSPHVAWQFLPLRDTFTVGAKAEVGIFTFKIEHQCGHPVDPYGLNDAPQFDSWHNRIEVTIRSKP
jgi:hypothetical protein